MPSLTIEYRDDSERLALEQAIAYFYCPTCRQLVLQALVLKGFVIIAQNRPTKSLECHKWLSRNDLRQILWSQVGQ